DEPDKGEAERDGRGRKGTANEQAGDAHRGLSPLPPLLPDVSVAGPPRMSTFALGVSRSWPSVTTSEPGGTPATTLRLSSVRSTVIGCVAAVPSLLTTNTYVPC